MCRGYDAAQLAYDRQEPPEQIEMWHCTACGSALFADSRVYTDKSGTMIGCEFCTQDNPAEIHFIGENY